MTDAPDPGHSPAAEAPGASTVLVFNDVASLVQSIGLHEYGSPAERLGSTADAGVATAVLPSREPAVVGQVAAPNRGRPVAVPVRPAGVEPPGGQSGQEVITDEERTRYGLLLDSAAERGLLDPADYEIRLRELAEATTTAQMVEIVTELPAFTPRAPGPTPARSRRSIQSANRAGSAAGQRRRVVTWALMGLLVVVALVSLVILALSAERLSHSRTGSLAPTPAPTRPVSALRL
jgi:DUF1707 SHOCT-like domain